MILICLVCSVQAQIKPVIKFNFEDENLKIDTARMNLILNNVKPITVSITLTGKEFMMLYLSGYIKGYLIYNENWDVAFDRWKNGDCNFEKFRKNIQLYNDSIAELKLLLFQKLKK